MLTVGLLKYFSFVFFNLNVFVLLVRLRNELIPPAEASTSAPAPSTDAPAPAPALSPAPEPATTRRPAPAPQVGCALGYDPYYTLGDPDEGYRFGQFQDIFL